MDKNYDISMNPERKRFLLLAPAIVLPFLVFFLWALGVGKGKSSTSKGEELRGILAGLPDLSKPLEDGLNKLEQYEKADRDSLRLRELIKNDPYHQRLEMIQGADQDSALAGVTETDVFAPFGGDSGELLSKEIYRKLSDLKSQLDVQDELPRDSYQTSLPFHGALEEKRDVDSQMMFTLNGPYQDSILGDPQQEKEISELNLMLDKVLDIQHPNRITDRTAEQKLKELERTFSVSANSGPEIITGLGIIRSHSDSLSKPIGFYSLDSHKIDTVSKGSIPAAVHGRQEVSSGAMVRLRLLEKVSIAGHDLPIGHLFFAQVNFSGERMEARIKHLRIGQALLPVDLQIYDLDGMLGIHLPASLLEQGIRESADRSIQNIGLGTLDPSWETKAASIGIQAAKNLMTKRIKVNKVVLPADYRVLLLDKTQNQKQRP